VDAAGVLLVDLEDLSHTAIHAVGGKGAGVLEREAVLVDPLAGRFGVDNRNLFVVGPDGKIAYRATPFREIDPTAYTDLGKAIDSLTPGEPGN